MPTWIVRERRKSVPVRKRLFFSTSATDAHQHQGGPHPNIHSNHFHDDVDNDTDSIDHRRADDSVADYHRQHDDDDDDVVVHNHSVDGGDDNDRKKIVSSRCASLVDV